MPFTFNTLSGSYRDEALPATRPSWRLRLSIPSAGRTGMKRWPTRHAGGENYSFNTLSGSYRDEAYSCVILEIASRELSIPSAGRTGMKPASKYAGPAQHPGLSIPSAGRTGMKRCCVEFGLSFGLHFQYPQRVVPG